MLDKTRLSLDQVILVDESDSQIGVMDKVEAHRHPAQLHRASSIFLFRRRKDNVELLIQRRSEYKIVGARQWANTVCVNLRPGESYESAAYRRVEEELGIKKVNLSEIYTFSYQLNCNQDFGENEIDHVFVGWYEGEIKPNSDEVESVQWVEFNQLENNQDLELAPWFKLMINDEVLVDKLNKWLEESVDEK
ncbi:MAG: isopentenyl-diphosphate Delta-isomerase [Candidatus Pacebacteria bacterium]|nr:isopentenyl-diphosphate Delta-isomerase [Candidatus Paceibacterota bacterium]MBT3512145.1 isopentenyl-diphosphate Delta-isomerase [Candidatus Paceibacterota bacterium]MBT4005393.1 isopentenyl-diphosphate Delta-isomerase [Candidatus Paceibacterota bacterium]MBT4359102.1 isopentenyl-diphosphate Delta-isomerase [Candidatus Paceibacterota bacterium]MBT4680981.1 isopentenyl-diphosphate Delta-isomerase [Candidatus Paceibacterota bacterium]